MLNMLITVIGELMGKVTHKSVQYSFKEKVGMISDIYIVYGQKWL